MGDVLNMQDLDSSYKPPDRMEDSRASGMVRMDSSMIQRRKRERDRNFTPAEVKLMIDMYEANKEVLNSRIFTNVENEKKYRVYQRMVDELNKMIDRDSEATSQRTVNQVRVKLTDVKKKALKCWSQYKEQKTDEAPSLGPGLNDWMLIQRIVRIMDSKESSSGTVEIADSVSDDTSTRKRSKAADRPAMDHPEASRTIESYLKKLTRLLGDLKKLGVDAGGVIFEEDAILCAGSGRLKQLITHPNLTDLLSEAQITPGGPKPQYRTSEAWTVRVVSSVGEAVNRQVDQSEKKTYNCDQCGSCFSQMCSLKIHQRRHSGVKPYVCDICDTSFYAAAYLSAHKEKKHGIHPARRRKRRKVAMYNYASTKPASVAGMGDSHASDSVSDSHQSDVVSATPNSQTEFNFIRTMINSFEGHGNPSAMSELNMNSQAATALSATNSFGEHKGGLSGLAPDGQADFTTASTGNTGSGNQHGVDVSAENGAMLAVVPTAISSIAGGKHDQYHTSVVMAGSKDSGSQETQQQMDQNYNDMLQQALIDARGGDDSSYVCKKCGRHFFTAQEFQTHFLSHNTRAKPFKCDQCGRGFAQLCTLKIHRRRHTGERPFMCAVCDASFYSASQLSDHKSKKHGLMPLQRRQKQNKTEKTHVCEYCSSVFPSESRLNEHRKTHTKPFRCDQCQQAFSCEGKLRKHKLWHQGIMPHQCHVCSRSFMEKGNLISHLRTHTGEKPYRCEYCNKAFTVSSALTVHRRQHTGETPYVCDICGAAFKVLASLNRHHDQHTGEKRYACTDCDLRFRDKLELEIHRRKHTGIQPHTCDVCGRHCATAYKLTVHRRLHTGEKPYTCTTCGERFARSDVLGQHKRKHEAFAGNAM